MNSLKDQVAAHLSPMESAILRVVGVHIVEEIVEGAGVVATPCHRLRDRKGPSGQDHVGPILFEGGQSFLVGGGWNEIKSKLQHARVAAMPCEKESEVRSENDSEEEETYHQRRC